MRGRFVEMLEARVVKWRSRPLCSGTSSLVFRWTAETRSGRPEMVLPERVHDANSGRR
jgi:hypothetical protein